MDASACAVLANGRIRMLRAGVTALLLAATTAPLPADAAWDRAVKLAKAAERLVPGTIATRTEEYSVDGKLRSTRERLMRARVMDGELNYEIVSASQNGQEVKPTPADAMTGASSMQFPKVIQADLPALAASQWESDQRMIGGQAATVYRIETPGELYTLRGRGWISEDGVPLELQYTVDPLPRTVKSLSISATYAQTDGMALVTKVAMQVAVRISIFHRRVYAITVELEDYFDPDG